ncbi:MAG: hypothetical protein AAFY08_14100 [Planctomycetota bacterium]
MKESWRFRQRQIASLALKSETKRLPNAAFEFRAVLSNGAQIHVQKREDGGFEVVELVDGSPKDGPFASLLADHLASGAPILRRASVALSGLTPEQQQLLKPRFRRLTRPKSKAEFDARFALDERRALIAAVAKESGIETKPYGKDINDQLRKRKQKKGKRPIRRRRDG